MPHKRGDLCLASDVPEFDAVILLPLAKLRPSGEKARVLIQPVCPFKMAKTCRLAISHSSTSPRPPALASVFPSGLKAMVDRVSIAKRFRQFKLAIVDSWGILGKARGKKAAE
ncbi:MAG: hypothetical protein R2880_15525 [Deinococcales bacterium]